MPGPSGESCSICYFFDAPAGNLCRVSAPGAATFSLQHAFWPIIVNPTTDWCGLNPLAILRSPQIAGMLVVSETGPTMAADGIVGVT